jgi:HEAT repeat protein
MEKKKIIDLLKSPDFLKRLDTLQGLPLHKTLSTLFSALCSEDEEVKWHAVTAAGRLVADLGERDPEAARDILRRMMWSLNEESGGIGWGFPEAMGETLARNETLAREFATLLFSYIQPEGNFLEFEPLQRGVLWAIGRLAEAFPSLITPLKPGAFLLPFLESTDTAVRGNALQALALLADEEILPRLEGLLRDREVHRLYWGGQLISKPIGDLAQEAIELIKKRGAPTREGWGKETH